MFKCVSCGEIKGDAEYYKVKSKRGFTSKCKVCIRSQVSLYRKVNVDKVMGYEMHRSSSGRIVDYRRKNPLKYKAHCLVNNALRDGRIVRPDTCSCCQSTSKLQAHHWSYEEEHWLNVVWLCTRCHADEHNRLRELGRDPDQV